MIGRRLLSTAKKEKLVVLCILDGWGYREAAKHNAVLQSFTPNFDALFGSGSQRGLVSFLDASERHVGLPEKQIGNSEVGHMNIGAGRVVWQDICTIDNAIEDDSLCSAEAFREHVETLKRTGGTSHLMGLVSPGGVHSLQSHVSTLANLLVEEGIPVKIHAFTDGRDVGPQDAERSFSEFLDSLDEGAEVVTVSGRYYAMDRDHRWERVKLAYDAIVSADSPHVYEAPEDAIVKAYERGETDEFVKPSVVSPSYKGIDSSGRDAILMANFRADRAREILEALACPLSPCEETFPSEDRPRLSLCTGMVKYSDAHEEYMSAIFPPKDIRLPLGEVVSRAGLTQLRTAETEKYPHVTFFFNGGREDPFPGEERILVPSPKVATYDLQPEMSAPEVSRRLCNELDSGKFNFVVVNFANPDMVGHTGDMNAAMKACEAVDECLGQVLESVRRREGAIVVTADHGNCELMWEDTTSQPHTAHTLNRVPVMLKRYDVAEGDLDGYGLRDGKLADLAPTVLDLLDLDQPDEMDGTSLLVDRGE